MQIDPNLLIAIFSGVLSGGVSYGAAMARLSKLERDKHEEVSLLREIIGKLDSLGNRVTAIETEMKFMRGQR